MTNTATRAVIALAIGLAFPVAVAPPAYAHNEVIASSPTAGEVLTQLPDAFFITTNEPMLELAGSNGFAVQVRDGAGAYYGDGCVQVVDATLSAVPQLGEPGEYTMQWQAVSEDGHTIDGTIPFTWEPAGTVTAAAGSSTAPVCGEAATPEPSVSASAPPASPDPVAEAPTASGIDLATVLWIGGAVLALAVAVAIAIAVASRRKR
jgi:methionine-rich copper-binding protein CopC